MLIPLLGMVSLTTTAAIPTETSSQSLANMIASAIEQDAQRQQFLSQSLALDDSAIAERAWLDPKLKVGVGGLPTNSFELNQDPMTNIAIGVMQQFERGNSRALKARQSEQQAKAVFIQSEQRVLEISNVLTRLWLELGFLQQERNILQKNQSLMHELTEVIETNYALGRQDTQDLLNAELQGLQFDEKLQANTQKRQVILAQLSEWVTGSWLEPEQFQKASNQLDWKTLTQKKAQMSTQALEEIFHTVPLVKLADQSIAAVRQTQVEIAKQAYQPQFGVELMYGHRQAKGMNGQPAPDLMSAFLTLDLPLFTENDQEKTTSAAQHQMVSAKFKKTALIRQLHAQLQSHLVAQSNLESRIHRFEKHLIPKANARTAAIRRGYKNNTTELNELIQASNEALMLQLEKQRLITDLNLVLNDQALLLNAFPIATAPPNHSEVNPMKTVILMIFAVLFGAGVGYGFKALFNIADHGMHQTMTSKQHENQGQMSPDQPLYWVAPMDPNFKRDKPGKSPMGMDLVPVYADEETTETEQGRIKINPAVVNNLGVKTTLVERKKLTTAIDSFGFVAFDDRSRWQINLRVSGWVEDLKVHSVGEQVAQGEVLFTLYSPELIKAQDELLNAVQMRRKILIEVSRERLLRLGMDQSQIDALIARGQSSQTIEIKAPNQGVITALNLQQGSYLTPSQTALSAAALDPIWVNVDVFESQIPWLSIGMPAQMAMDAWPARQWQGKVDYIYPELDPKSRTVQVRLKFANPQGELKPNMSARLKLLSERKEAELVIPKSAVIQADGMSRVVLAEGEGEFRSARIRLGQSSLDQVVVIEGLNEGDRIVTSAQFLLDSESSKTADLSRINGMDRNHQHEMPMNHDDHQGHEMPMKSISENAMPMNHGDIKDNADESWRSPRT